MHSKISIYDPNDSINSNPLELHMALYLLIIVLCAALLFIFLYRRKNNKQNDMNLVEASNIITDEYSARILVATYRKPKSALELSQKFGIPIAACYRRIRLLEKMGFLACFDKTRSQKGKIIKLYLSRLKNVHISLDEGKYRVRFILKSGDIKDSNDELTLVDDSS